MPGPQAYALKCPGCGAALKVANDLETFACMYCGATVKVEKSGGTVNLRIAEELVGVRKGTDKTAAELAIRRLQQELAQLKRQADALSERRQRVTHEHMSRIGQLQDPRTPILIAVVAGVTSAIACLIVLGPGESRAVIAALVTGAASYLAYKSVKGPANARIREYEAKLEAAIAEIAPDEELLLAKIATKQAKLDDALQIADS